MTRDDIDRLAGDLRDLASLRDLLAALNFDFADEIANKANWDTDQTQMVLDARIVARKDDYHVFYIQTKSDSLKTWKGIASTIIKGHPSPCMVCSHNPGGFKWVFSSLSKKFSQSFRETRHIPIDIGRQSGAPRPFVEFLKKIKVVEPNTTSIMAAVSEAFDEFAVKIHDELTINVFEALKTLSEGIITDESNGLLLDEETLEEIREPAFILLYRIMFVLYAEDRAIFPDSRFYYDEFSLKWIKQEWILKQSPNSREYEAYDRLKRLFRLIESGSEDLDYDPSVFCMQSYYGRLFDRKIHTLLDNWKIPNKNVLEAIGMLTRTVDRQGNWFFLDYAALETRHLGAIYERLLEYHLTVRDGRIDDLPSTKERKSTGSYYTPQYIVNYIVENTVGPIIDKIEKTEGVDEQIDKILDLNILDPAMGSGHFLVGVINYMAERICKIECGDDVSEQKFVERKRDVARRCVYGVDLNPLAVDLAAVSLWLETLSSDKPLSFLSAHLKSGNSLIGSSIDKMLEKQTALTEASDATEWSLTKARAGFKKIVNDFIVLETLEDDTPEAVKTKIRKYDIMRARGTVYYDLKFLLDAKVAKSFGVDVPILGDYTAQVGQNSLDFASDSRWAEVAAAARRHSFFHWDLEFPDIFYGRDGKSRNAPGFDAVVGNPPYGAELSHAERQYHKQRYREIGSTDTAQLMAARGCSLLSYHGFNGFIVPKALVYASNWTKIREYILPNLLIVVDCGKVWKEVKLEQIIYVYQNDSKNSVYKTGSREHNIFVTHTEINKAICDQFGFILTGIKSDELLLGQKIFATSTRLSEYITNSRGGMLQNQIKKKGDRRVLGGAQIKRYNITQDHKGYVDTKDCDNKSYVLQNSILAQCLVAHIQNPTDHIKITATIPPHTDFVILDTVNQIVVKKISPHYVLGLLNSKLVNWYMYRFVFAKTIRTMHFDNPVTNRIPIVVVDEESISKQVKKILSSIQKTTDSTKTESLTTLENELNHMFYHVFGLNESEICMIEESTPE